MNSLRDVYIRTVPKQNRNPDVIRVIGNEPVYVNHIDAVNVLAEPSKNNFRFQDEVNPENWGFNSQKVQQRPKKAPLVIKGNVDLFGERKYTRRHRIQKTTTTTIAPPIANDFHEKELIAAENKVEQYGR